MTTLLLNETLVKFPLLSDGKRNSFSLISFKNWILRETIHLTHTFFSFSFTLTLAICLFLYSLFSSHFYYYRESQTIHFICSQIHAHIHFNINHHFFFSNWTSKNTSFYIFAKRTHIHTHEKKRAHKNLNTTEFQPFRIVKIFPVVV